MVGSLHGVYAFKFIKNIAILKLYGASSIQILKLA